MEEINNKNEILTTTFHFNDKEQHEIDPEILINYIKILQIYCQKHGYKLSICPSESGSYKFVAMILLKVSVGGSVLLFSDYITAIGNGIVKGINDNYTPDFVEEKTKKSVSIFFKNLKDKNIKSVEMNERVNEKNNSCIITNEDFSNFILDEEREDRKENITLKVNLNEVEITQKGSIVLKKEDIEKIKNTTTYQNIMMKFNNYTFMQQNNEENNLFSNRQ